MQSATYVLLVRPKSFAFNHETSQSNAFQKKDNKNFQEINQKALIEFNSFAEILESKNINVFILEDTKTPEKPDAIFPNNWITFHENGTVIIYPMFAPNRRTERRNDIIESLKKQFDISKIIDLSHYENENRFLEGTGSIVFDHKEKIAYACLSPRTDKNIFIEVCTQLKYQPIFFYAHDENGKEIYHTNVMMSIGNGFAVACLESISNVTEREDVKNNLILSGREVIEISLNQMNCFAGNMLCLKTKLDHIILAMSQQAFDCLDNGQIKSLEKYCELVSIPIPTIETVGGGSIRCMIAENFLPQK